MKHSKKSWQKYLAVMLTVALVGAPVVPGSTVSAASSSAKSISVSSATDVIVIGNTYKLSYKLTPSTSKDKITFKSSNAKIATVSSKGVITPKGTGYVTVSATTQSGKKASVKFLSVGKSGVSTWQTRINKMLKADNVKTITIKESAVAKSYKIPSGDYSKKLLAVNAPFSDVTNNGTFREIDIVDVKNGTWHENGKNNSFDISDDSLSFVVEKVATVKSLDFTAPNAQVDLRTEGAVEQVNVKAADTKINIDANSTIGKIVLDSNADVVIKGNADKVVVSVTEKAKGAKIESAVKLEASVGSDVEIKLVAGAEGSKVEKSASDVKVGLSNATKEKVEIATSGSDKKETVDAGKTTSDTPAGGGAGGSTGGSTTPSTKTETVNGVSSSDGKTATYTLPTDITSLKSAKVNVDANSDGKVDKTYDITGEVLTYVSKLLVGEATYVNLWKTTSAFKTVTQGGITVSFEGEGMTKKVTFDSVVYDVTVNDNGTIKVKKVNGTAAYILSKENKNKLIISSVENANVSKLVSFEVTY